MKFVPIVIFLSVLGVLLFSQCASHQFPKFQPLPKSDRYAIARARAEDYFIKARDYDRRGLNQMAEHFYELAYKLDPNSVVLRDLLVNKYIASKKYKQAVVVIKGQKKINDLSDEDKKVVSNLYLKMQQFGKAAETLELIGTISGPEKASLGYIYERLRDNKKAIKNYSEYFIESPQALNIALKIASLYIKEQKYDKAESLYVYLEKQFENKTEILNGLGTISLLKKDTTTALNFFKTAIILDSTSSKAFQKIAQIYIAKGDYGKAVEYYEKIVASDYLSNQYNKRTLALLYYYNKQLYEAEELLKLLITNNLDDYELHFYLGLVFAENDKLELAEIEFQKTLAIKDNYADAWMHLCYLSLKKKNWDRAFDYAQKFNKRMPKAGASWRIYGYTLNIKKRYEEAIGVLKKAVSFDSEESSIWFELGTAYERTRSYKKAADAFRKVLSLKPNDDAAANYLGYMWAEQNKNLDSAEALLEMALAKDPENGAYLDSYAWIFFKKGDLDSAEKYIKLALKQISDDPIIYDHLGDILLKKGDASGAMKAYKKSLKLDFEDKEAIRRKINKLLKKHNGQLDTPILNDL